MLEGQPIRYLALADGEASILRPNAKSRGPPDRVVDQAMPRPTFLKTLVHKALDRYRSIRTPMLFRAVAGRLMPPYFGYSRMRSVFVVTYGRSGSTLLNRYLSSLPGFDIKGENGLFITPAMECEKRLSFALRHKSLLRDASTGPWYGASSLRLDKWRRDIRRALINQLYPRFPIPKTIGFKEIRWSDVDPEQLESTLDWMRSMRPPGAIIFLFRRHDDVMKSAWWASQSETEQAMSCQRLRAFEARCRQYSTTRPESSVVIQYEEFVSDPRSPRELCKVLGVRFRESVWRRVLSRQLTHLKQ